MTGQVSVVELVNAIAVLILAGLIAWSKFKTGRNEKANCSNSADIENRLQTIAQELVHLKWSIEDIRDRVMKLEMSVDRLKE